MPSAPAVHRLSEILAGTSKDTLSQAWGETQAATDFIPLPRGEYEATIIRGELIDASVYDKVRAFRAPNSKHPKTDLHKRRLTHDELMGLSVDCIRQLAERPEPFDMPTPPVSNKLAAKEWADAAALTRQEAEGKAQRRAAVAMQVLILSKEKTR